MISESDATLLSGDLYFALTIMTFVRLSHANRRISFREASSYGCYEPALDEQPNTALHLTMADHAGTCTATNSSPSANYGFGSLPTTCPPRLGLSHTQS